MALSSHSCPSAPEPILAEIFSTLPVPSASIFVRSGLLDCFIQQVDSPLLLTSNTSVSLGRGIPGLRGRSPLRAPRIEILLLELPSRTRCREGERRHGGEAGAPPARCGGGWLVPIDAPLLGALGRGRGRPGEAPPRLRVGPGAAAPDRGAPSRRGAARPWRRPPRRGQIERRPREAPGARGHLLMPRRGRGRGGRARRPVPAGGRAGRLAVAGGGRRRGRFYTNGGAEAGGAHRCCSGPTRATDKGSLPRGRGERDGTSFYGFY